MMNSDDLLAQTTEMMALLPSMLAADRKAVVAFARARAQKYGGDSASVPALPDGLIVARNVGGFELVNANRREFQQLVPA